MSSPSLTPPGDLTARARIRNEAFSLYAIQGEERVSMRAVAAAAGVTIGLVQHHFGTKEGLRRSVDEYVVEHFVEALAGVEHTGTAAEVVAARDGAVRTMLQENPLVVRYLLRMLLEPETRGAFVLGQLVDLTVQEIRRLREAGFASTTTPEPVQVVRTILGQIGEHALEPMVGAVWKRVGGSDADRPRTEITVVQPTDPRA